MKAVTDIVSEARTTPLYPSIEACSIFLLDIGAQSAMVNNLSTKDDFGIHWGSGLPENTRREQYHLLFDLSMSMKYLHKGTKLSIHTSIGRSWI